MAESSVEAGKKVRPRTEAAPAIQRMVETMVLKPEHRVLCYGCGRGADVLWLKRRGFHAVGYDPHPPFGYTDSPEGVYDFVFLVYLMTRLRSDGNRRGAIEKALECARPGGHLVVVSRSWAGFPGENGGDALLRPFQELVEGLEFEAVEALEALEEDPSVCVVGKRSGVYKPRNPVAWVEDARELEEVCGAIRREPYVALDVETTLEEPRKLCTIQLATESHTWIVDALAVGDLDPVKGLLEDGGVEKIIHNAMFETQMFAKHAIRIVNVLDTLPESRKKYRRKNVLGGHKLGTVCERELGVFLDKALQTSDWTVRPLTQAQLDYAAVDAEVLVALRRVFRPPSPPENLELF